MVLRNQFLTKKLVLEPPLEQFETFVELFLSYTPISTLNLEGGSRQEKIIYYVKISYKDSYNKTNTYST